MHFRHNAKIRKKHSGEIKGFIFLLAAFVIGYFLILPDQSGVVGKSISNFSFLVFGNASYLIPVIFAWFGIIHFKPLEYQPRPRLDTVFSLLLVICCSSFFSLFGAAFYGADLGGVVGSRLAPFFSRLFGKNIALLVTFLLSAYFATRLLRISIKLLLMSFFNRLVQDFKEWQDARAELKKEIPVKRNSVEPVFKTQREDIKELPKKTVEPRIIMPDQNQPAAKKRPVQEIQKESKPAVSAEKSQQPLPYILPELSLLSGDNGGVITSEEEHRQKAALLMKTLKDFDIEASVEMIISGPVVTRYELSLAPGIKVQEVISLSENIGLAMKSPSIRVISVPEKSMVGVEVPNTKPSIVGLRGILSSEDFQSSKSLLTLALGKTTDGAPYVSDLGSMPHLLIAGATGSGKSVGIHSLILSILYKARPDEVKFIIIDPKRVEMPLYRKLPHLYDPRVPADKADIITNPKDANQSLKKLVSVMESRYEKYAKETVRNIEGYNEKMSEKGQPKDFYILVIIDELADLMVSSLKEIEDNIQRLAQMARAVGIHLVLATQRPSVNVITGVIKANFSARVAFQTTSKVDSRVIIDTIGADSLLGRGDMLFMPPGESRLIRLQGAFVSVKDAEKVVEFIAAQNVPKQYEELSSQSLNLLGLPQDNEKEAKELSQALLLVKERRRVSQDLLKAHFGSSARATNILSLLEIKGFIGKPEGTNRWSINFDKIDEYLNVLGSTSDNEQIS